MGAFVAVAWLRDKSIGVWISLASAALFVSLLFAGGRTTTASGVVTSGVCAGILCVMLTNYIVRLKGCQ